MAIPTNGLIAHLTCELIDDGKTPVFSGKGAVAIAEGGEVIEDGVRGKALGMYGPAARIILRGLRQREDACTISTWVRFRDKTQDIGIWSRIENTWPQHMHFGLRHERLVVEWQRESTGSSWYPGSGSTSRQPLARKTPSTSTASWSTALTR